MIRVLHFSDVHVDVPWFQLPWSRMANKRLLAQANLVLRRGRRFRRTRDKLVALTRFADALPADLVVCTGDYTAMGTDVEHRAARACIESLTRAPLGYVTVPGNHDVYLADTLRDGLFERHFGEFLDTDLPQYRVDGPWPLVRLVGDSLAVVCVNSARPNPQPWRSSGRIPDAQLGALRSVLSDARVCDRLVLVLTHYAPRRRDGSPDGWHHGLENADALLSCCETVPRCAVLHGHIHWRYHVSPGARGPELFGAGSATDEGREGLWVFELEPQRARAIPGCFEAGAYRLDASQVVEF